MQYLKHELGIEKSQSLCQIFFFVMPVSNNFYMILPTLFYEEGL